MFCSIFLFLFLLACFRPKDEWNQRLEWCEYGLFLTVMFFHGQVYKIFFSQARLLRTFLMLAQRAGLFLFSLVPTYRPLAVVRN